VQQAIEELSGNGKILIGERQVATAAYGIVVAQEYIDTQSFEGHSRVPGLKSARGQLQVLSGPKDLEMAVEWTLVLSDGRRCHCVASGRLGITSGEYSFVVSGGIG